MAARVWRRDGSSKVEAARRWGQGGGKVVAKWSWRGSGDEAVVTLDGGGTVVVFGGGGDTAVAFGAGGGIAVAFGGGTVVMFGAGGA